MNNQSTTTVVPFTVVDTFFRPRFKIKADFFADDLMNDQYVFSAIDPVIASALNRLAVSDELIEDEMRHYMHYHTGSEKMNDRQIATTLEFVIPILSLNEILVTAAYLITQDMNGKGPLSKLYPEDQENLNIGDFIEGKRYLAFIERKKPIPGKVREYHFHTNEAPRIEYPYKPYRNMLFYDNL